MRAARAEVDDGAEGVGVRGQAGARGGEVPGEMREEGGVRGETGGEEDWRREAAGTGSGGAEGAEEGDRDRHSGGTDLEGNPRTGASRLRWLLTATPTLRIFFFLGFKEWRFRWKNTL